MSTNTIRKLQPHVESAFFDVHQTIVYGCLRSLGIYLNNPNYDDYKQIGLLALVEAYETFPHTFLNEENYYQFTGFAFQKVKWKILDEMRKTSRVWEQELSVEKEKLDAFKRLDYVEEEEAQLSFLLLESMMQHLNENEQDYLYETVINQRNVTDFAKIKGVSRKTVYEWKKNIARKLEHYKKALRS